MWVGVRRQQKDCLTLYLYAAALKAVVVVVVPFELA